MDGMAMANKTAIAQKGGLYATRSITGVSPRGTRQSAEVEGLQSDIDSTAAGRQLRENVSACEQILVFRAGVEPRLVPFKYCLKNAKTFERRLHGAAQVF